MCPSIECFGGPWDGEKILKRPEGFACIVDLPSGWYVLNSGLYRWTEAEPIPYINAYGWHEVSRTS